MATITSEDMGDEVTVRSVYLKPEDRFVVSLVSSYGDKGDEIVSVEQAAAAAWAMTMDSQSNGTIWSVFDRHTGLTSFIDQGDIEEIALIRKLF